MEKLLMSIAVHGDGVVLIFNVSHHKIKIQMDVIM